MVTASTVVRTDNTYTAVLSFHHPNVSPGQPILAVRNEQLDTFIRPVPYDLHTDLNVYLLDMTRRMTNVPCKWETVPIFRAHSSNPSYHPRSAHSPRRGSVGP